MRLCLFQLSLRDQASNWLERLPARSITTWEDLTTRFLAQFFPPGRTAKLHNDIQMFQQHHAESLSEAWTPGGKLRDLNAEESWALLEDLTLYDNKSWNDPKDFAKLVKAIALPQDVRSTSDRCLIELENQVQRLMEANLAPLGVQHTSLMLMPMQSIPTLAHKAIKRPPSLKSLLFPERTGLSLNPPAIWNYFEARQREEINDRMTKMFRLLKQLTTNRTPKKVLIREEAKFPVTKNVNSISLARGEEERSDKTDETLNNTVKPTRTETEILVKEAERNNETKNKPIKKAKEE
ncbi:MAK10-like protein [Tanacetum coccineum]